MFPFVLDVDAPGALVVKEDLAEDEFEVIFVHVQVRSGHFVIAHIGEIEGRAVAVTALRDGVDIAAALQVLDVFLRAKHGGDIKAIMGESVAAQDIRPLCSDGIQLALRRGDEIRYGVRQAVHNIVVVGCDLNETLAHRCGIGAVFGRSRQTDRRCYFMLFGMQVIELDPIVKRPPGIPNKAVFDDSLFFLRCTCSA